MLLSIINFYNKCSYKHQAVQRCPSTTAYTDRKRHQQPPFLTSLYPLISSPPTQSLNALMETLALSPRPLTPSHLRRGAHSLSFLHSPPSRLRTLNCSAISPPSLGLPLSPPSLPLSYITHMCVYIVCLL